MYTVPMQSNLVKLLTKKSLFIRSIWCASHLDTMLGRLAHRLEVRHNVGNQVGAHFHSGVKVILKQTTRQLHSFNLRNAGVV